jgi:hypothetical protein
LQNKYENKFGVAKSIKRYKINLALQNKFGAAK